MANEKNVGIITLHTGFNYGTSLQAYALKELVASMGYFPTLYWYEDSLVKGRDVRWKKLFTMLIRTITRPKVLINTYRTYKKSIVRKDIVDNKEEFFAFTHDHLNVQKIKYGQLEADAHTDKCIAYICGSDQIWNATSTNVDPIFYLRFAPYHKRISYAPSFGKSTIAEYNQGILKKYLTDFAHISVREDQGAIIVRELIGRHVPVVLDPTLTMSKEFWSEKIKNRNDQYILFYFLDKPTEAAMNKLKDITVLLNRPIKALSYKYDEFYQFKDLTYVQAGPFEFVEYIANARFVCTDSFHGVAFSANMNTPFYVFGRNYGTATDQSSRISSLLKKLRLESRLVSENTIISSESLSLNFTESNALLTKERGYSIVYLENALCEVQHSAGE